jgi:hypothetical protein
VTYSQPAKIGRPKERWAFWASTKKVPWNASAASLGSASSREQVLQTSGPCRVTNAENASRSPADANAANKSASGLESTPGCPVFCLTMSTMNFSAEDIITRQSAPHSPSGWHGARLKPDHITYVEVLRKLPSSIALWVPAGWVVMNRYRAGRGTLLTEVVSNS